MLKQKTVMPLQIRSHPGGPSGPQLGFGREDLEIIPHPTTAIEPPFGDDDEAVPPVATGYDADVVGVEFSRVRAREKVEQRFPGAGFVDEDVGVHLAVITPAEGHAYEEEGAIRAGNHGRHSQVARIQLGTVDDAA